MPRGPEYQRMQRITQALRQYSWLHTHFRPLRTEAGYRTPLSGDKGYPDITAVHPERGLLLFIEVKSDKGRLSSEQEAWITALREATRPCISRTCAQSHEHGVEPVWLCGTDESEAELLALISGGRIA